MSTSEPELVGTILDRLNFGIVKEGNSAQQNAKETALDLMCRASALHDAAHYLQLPYTYTILAEGTKAKAREQIGRMSVEIIEAMRDELTEAAIEMWFRGQGLTKAEADAILGVVRARRHALGTK